MFAPVEPVGNHAVLARQPAGQHVGLHRPRDARKTRRQRHAVPQASRQLRQSRADPLAATPESTAGSHCAPYPYSLVPSSKLASRRDDPRPQHHRRARVAPEPPATSPLALTSSDHGRIQHNERQRQFLTAACTRCGDGSSTATTQRRTITNASSPSSRYHRFSLRHRAAQSPGGNGR